MRNSIASYKESLSRIAHEVLDASREEEREAGLVSARHIVHLSPASPQRHPLANGTDLECNNEIAKYRVDIQKLQASESEIKALSFNYAALLIEKEEQLCDLRLENGELRSRLETRNVDESLSRDESLRTLSNHSITSKENEKFLEEVTSIKAINADIKILKKQLTDEQAIAEHLKTMLNEERKLKETSYRELQDLKTDTVNISKTNELQEELDLSLSELRRLKDELNKKDLEIEQLNESTMVLNSAMQSLEMKKLGLVAENNELEEKLNYFLNNNSENNDDEGSTSLKESKNDQNEENMELKVQGLVEMLKEACNERDKASQELLRLKQHLLDKELEDEEKMSEDLKIIEELKTMAQFQRAQISQLENALLQERTKGVELNKVKLAELHQSHETIQELNKKLANFMSIIDAKNAELQNLQTALGQYYAESEAKERFGRELAAARDESAKYLELLKTSDKLLEICKRENEGISACLSQTEKLLSETKASLRLLEDDNLKLRRALEQSMTTLNRMSHDSDIYVDRRIVIKLLVTYFQRNHGKEVLDLMVRMLGFSEEDKQRIGFAQHSAGKGAIRGALGLPGRLVGGIFGAAQSSSLASENQSFADLWVDFLLKETEGRERAESS